MSDVLSSHLWYLGEVSFRYGDNRDLWALLWGWFGCDFPQTCRPSSGPGPTHRPGTPWWSIVSCPATKQSKSFNCDDVTKNITSHTVYQGPNNHDWESISMVGIQAPAYIGFYTTQTVFLCSCLRFFNLISTREESNQPMKHAKILSYWILNMKAKIFDK